MNCRTLLAVLGACSALVLAALPPAAAAQARRNVLFIAVDDLRPELACYGNRIVKTPNLDKLAEQGVRFDRAYCQYPLCNPSRASLFTGRYPTSTGVMDNLKYFRDQIPDVVTLPQHFKQNGYVSARAGKQFHGGIDDEASWTEGYEPRQERMPRTPQQAADYRKTSDRWLAAPSEENQGDYRTASRVIQLLEKHKDGAFFIAAGFAKPHSPLIAAKTYFDLYDPEKIPLPPGFSPTLKVPDGAPQGALTQNGDLFIQREPSEQEAREMIRAYYACVSQTDAQVGRILAALDRLGLREKTIVVFFGDHGYHLGEMGKWSKHNSLYEEGTRVPIIISAPDRARGKACLRTVELVDLYPTLIGLAGLTVPPGLEGQNLDPLLRDPSAKWDHPAYSYTRSRPGVGQSVRDERYRLTSWANGGLELYDYEKDPVQRRNLAADPEYAPVVERMKKLLRP
jgi:iduronate 2-sulfatase